MGLEKNVVSDIQNMMIKNKYILAFLGILMLSGIAATCQISDNQLWTRATLKFRVNKNLRFDVEEQARFKNDISRLKITLTEGSIVYDLTKRSLLKVTSDISAIHIPTTATGIRVTFPMTFPKKVSRLTLNTGCAFKEILRNIPVNQAVISEINSVSIIIFPNLLILP
jgi:hypothetical protein